VVCEGKSTTKLPVAMIQPIIASRRLGALKTADESIAADCIGLGAAAESAALEFNPQPAKREDRVKWSSHCC
jgi:hypothetical protein